MKQDKKTSGPALDATRLLGLDRFGNPLWGVRAPAGTAKPAGTSKPKG